MRAARRTARALFATPRRRLGSALTGAATAAVVAALTLPGLLTPPAPLPAPVPARAAAAGTGTTAAGADAGGAGSSAAGSAAGTAAPTGTSSPAAAVSGAVSGAVVLPTANPSSLPIPSAPASPATSAAAHAPALSGPVHVPAPGAPAYQALYKSLAFTTTTAQKSWTGTPQAGVIALIAADFPADQVPNATAVALCESGIQSVTSAPNTDGSRDWGVFQLNDGGTLQSLLRGDGRPASDLPLALDPTWNVHAAAVLFHQRGWQPWTCAAKLGLVPPAPHGAPTAAAGAPPAPASAPSASPGAH